MNQANYNIGVHVPNTDFTIPAKTKGAIRVLPVGHYRPIGDTRKYYLNRYAGQALADSINESEVPLMLIMASDSGRPAPPAAGWFSKASWREDGLYINDLTLSKAATKAIEEREYLYFQLVVVQQEWIPKLVLGMLLSNERGNQIRGPESAQKPL